MSDLAKPAAPGKEQAHAGNVSPSAKPPGKELATNANANLANAGNANKSV